MSKLIPLTQGYSAIVDDDDYDYLMQWKWHASKNANTYYANTAVTWFDNGVEKKQTLKMHRELIGITGMCVDHINHNGLDNRRMNLRLCTHSQNIWNSRPRGNTSKFKGVSWHSGNKRWTSAVSSNGKRINLGSFISEVDAALAYDKAAMNIHGEFAHLNFPRIAALLAEKG